MNFPPKKNNECLESQMSKRMSILSAPWWLRVAKENTQQTSNCHQTSSRRVFFAAGKTLEKIWESIFCFQIFLAFLLANVHRKSYICWRSISSISLVEKKHFPIGIPRHGSGDVDLQRCPENGGCGEEW